MQIRVIRYDTIDSTNSEALRQARQGAAEGLCIVAEEQTAGRGRLGREWVSQKGDGLYFSIVLRPGIDESLITLLTLMSAVSVHDALLRSAVNADIKWVNDLLVGERKICGILAEATETPGGMAVVVGIGINLRSRNLPVDVAAIATSIEEETGLSPNVERLIEDLCDALTAKYELLGTSDGPQTIRRLWSERSSYADGKKVTVNMGDRSLEGITRGIEDDGGLKVETENGTIVTVRAGDVTRLRSNGPCAN